MWLAELLQMKENMSGLPRWKENRIRQEIHLADLKHARLRPTEPALMELTHQGRTELRSASSSKDRILGPINKPRTEGTRIDFPGMILRLALLAIGVAAWLWMYLGQFEIHR
jgi:hypothetical protein